MTAPRCLTGWKSAVDSSGSKRADLRVPGRRQHHEDHKRWLESVVNAPAVYGVSPQVLCGVVRVCTHPRIFVQPSSLAEALEFCRTLLEQPNATMITPGERHWSIFESLCRQSKASGNLIQDAWFATLAIESGCEWITSDRDFVRFPGLTWSAPY